MKKLEDIPKSNPFSVPEGYFDKLPGVIQSRIAEGTVKREVPYFRYALQYAIPVIALIIVAIIYLSPKAESYNDLLDSVGTEQLAVYLSDSDLTTEEILESGDLDEESAEAIETEVYFNNIDLDGIDELDL